MIFSRPDSSCEKSASQHAMRGASAGFTLVEMMVVVAIVAILASIGVPRMIKYVRTAETTEAVEYAAKITKDVQAFADKNVEVSTSTLTGYLNPSSLGNLGGGTPANEITTLIQQIMLPSDAAFSYQINGTVSGADRTVNMCITAIKRNDTNMKIYYSSAATTVTGWEGKVFRKIYVDGGSGTLTAGGYCTTTGGVAATPS